MQFEGMNRGEIIVGVCPVLQKLKTSRKCGPEIVNRHSVGRMTNFSRVFKTDGRSWMLNSLNFTPLSARNYLGTTFPVPIGYEYIICISDLECRYHEQQPNDTITDGKAPH